ncbi:Spermathecal Physiology Variant [Caenorhabditis elegans]
MCVNVHASLEMVSESMRDLFKYSQFKTNPIILLSLQLVQAVKDLKFDTCSVDTTPVLNIIDQLESAVLNIILNRHIVSSVHHTPSRSSTLGRWKQNNSTDSYLRQSGPLNSVSQTLQRRHSTHQTNPDPNDQSTEKVMEIDKLLISRTDGVDVAFERTKAWSTYSKDVISYVRARIQLEQDHARKVHTLVDTSRRDINKPFMPLREIFENSFDTEVEMVTHTKETTEHLKDRVVEALDARRKEHDTVRNALKVEWTKATKSLHDCEESYEKSKITLRMREEALKKARESCLRTESSPPEREASRRRRDLEKKSRAVEEAMIKKEEAERQVVSITAELRKKRRDIDKTKESVVERLRELIFQCEQTTKACTVHYFTSLAALWARLPGAFHELSNATRDYQPGTEYMAFLQTLPTRAASSSSLVRSDRSIDEGVASCDGSSSLTSLRRNAINPDDEGALPDTKRHKKTSYAGRTFDNHEISTAAQSHHIQRTVQPSKCSACDTLSILYTVQCIDCGGQWHKACFPRIQQVCGQAAKLVDRRTSIFGVPLKGLLEHQNRHIPLIIEKSIDQLQRRGLRAKGIYRTCGVKSKIEEICNAFERSSSDDEVCLDNENPMNLASVVKLYLRKLPEPLLTFELYDDFVRLGTECCSAQASGSNCEEERVEQLRQLARKLPVHNYETLKFIMLHLNRVSWFHEVNLMSTSNLSTVIAPSLIWMSPKRIDHTSAIMHTQYTNKAIEVMIRNSYHIFGMDRQADWQSFFSRYSVEEPPKEEEEEDCGNESDIEDDIEDLDEQDRSDEDDDEEIFLPPTPDILKTTRKPVEQTTSLPNPKLPVERISSGRRSNNNEPPTIVQRRTNDISRRSDMGDKRKSYTTSIVIAPRDGSPDHVDQIQIIERDVYDKGASLEQDKTSARKNRGNSPLLQEMFAEGSVGRTMLLFGERMCTVYGGSNKQSSDSKSKSPISATPSNRRRGFRRGRRANTDSETTRNEYGSADDDCLINDTSTPE